MITMLKIESNVVTIHTKYWQGGYGSRIKTWDQNLPIEVRKIEQQPKQKFDSIFLKTKALIWAK